MLAAKLELGLTEGRDPEGTLLERSAAEAANGATLSALWLLRQEVLSELAGLGSAGEEAGAFLRIALATLAPIVTKLANPATPMPEEKRGEAARMLKALLRAGMIDEGW